MAGGWLGPVGQLWRPGCLRRARGQRGRRAAGSGGGLPEVVGAVFLHSSLFSFGFAGTVVLDAKRLPRRLLVVRGPDPCTRSSHRCRGP